MRRRLAVILTASLLGAALLFASDSWNGFTLTAECHDYGGGAFLSYPAMSSGESCSLSIVVYFTSGAPGFNQISKSGPCSAGQISTGYGTAGARNATHVDASATCVYGGQTGYLNDTDYP